MILSRAQCRAVLLAESRGVEPHPISENLVFKASRRTIPAALLSRIVERVERIELSRYPWQGHKLPLHHTRKNLAESVGVEPTRPFRSVGLAIRCLTIQPTLLVVIVII